MPEIGSYVLYDTNGICLITDKRTESLYGVKREYFVLSPIETNSSVIYVPADNTQLVSKLKNILSKDEAILTIKNAGNREIVWIADSKQRNDVFNEILINGDRTELLRMIRCLHTKKEELSAENKKLRTTDENILKKAEKIINDEFSIVFEISNADVPEYIRRITAYI